jgi:hypothetical protein
LDAGLTGVQELVNQQGSSMNKGNVMRSSLSKVTLAVLAVFGGIAQAADSYVSAAGNDSNAGTQNSPWRSIGKAISAIPSGGNHNIYLGDGTFTEANYIKLPSGVAKPGHPPEN